MNTFRYSCRTSADLKMRGTNEYAEQSEQNGLLSPEVLMQPGCTSRSWLTLCALRSARGLT